MNADSPTTGLCMGIPPDPKVFETIAPEGWVFKTATSDTERVTGFFCDMYQSGEWTITEAPIVPPGPAKEGTFQQMDKWMLEHRDEYFRRAVRLPSVAGSVTKWVLAPEVD